MNLINNTPLLDHLASSYAVGTLRGGARRRFETMAREQAPVRAAALVWQTRLASLNELQPGVAPAPAVWTRLDNLLRSELAAKAMQATRQASPPAAGLGGWLNNLFLWRGAAAAGALATVVVLVAGINLRTNMGNELAQLQTQLQAVPLIEYVAVLADDKSTASMLVTFDANSKKLTLQRIGGFQEAGHQSLQLWALPPAGGPRSLGVLGTDKLLRLTAAEGDVREVPTLAISLEPKGGVPSAGGPTGPVLFKGPLIQKVL